MEWNYNQFTPGRSMTPNKKTSRHWRGGGSYDGWFKNMQKLRTETRQSLIPRQFTECSSVQYIQMSRPTKTETLRSDDGDEFPLLPALMRTAVESDELLTALWRKSRGRTERAKMVSTYMLSKNKVIPTRRWSSRTSTRIIRGILLILFVLPVHVYATDTSSRHAFPHQLDFRAAHGAFLRQSEHLESAVPADAPVPTWQHGRRMLVLKADLTRVLPRQKLLACFLLSRPFRKVERASKQGAKNKIVKRRFKF